MKNITDQDGQSADIINDNIEQLKTLFPDAFTENGVNFGVLRQLLGDAKVLDEGEEKYGLNWHGKKKARQIALTPSMGTLRPCPEESVDWDTTKNLFIEGDNLEVLKLLQKSYAGRVKMIYIDPPYNTGKEFIYPDKFQDNLNTYLRYTGQKDAEGIKTSSSTENSGRYHTNWLNMMYPRLKLAKSLLRNNGAIFISIDDTEVANLRAACDEIFGAENFIANVVWQKKYSPQNDATYFSDMHDHILVYAKRKRFIKSDLEGWILDLLPRTEEQNARYTNRDNDPRGPWKAGDASVKSYSASYDYPITTPNGRVVNPPRGRCWFTSKEKMGVLIDDNRIWFGEDGGNVPAIKQHLSDVKDGRVPTTWWTFSECGHNQEAKKEVNALMGDDAGIFDTPKPIRLMHRIFDLTVKRDKDAIILDFFSGSGTIADACYQYNLKDFGNRKFICVQLPEPIKHEVFKTISDVAIQRIKLSGLKVREKKTDYTGDLGFKVFKLDSSNIRAWNPDRTDLEATLMDHKDHLVPGRSEQDVLYELLLKRGVDLTVPIEQKEFSGKTVYSIGYGVLFACLDEVLLRTDVDTLANGILEWHRELDPDTDSHIFFRDSAFADDVAKTNMAAILEQNGISHVRSL